MLPLKTDAPAGAAPLTLVLLLLLGAVFAYQLTLGPFDDSRFVDDWALVPARLWPSIKAGLPWPELVRLLSSAFLHAGWVHFLVNAWTLWILGRTLEPTLGMLAYLGLYAGAAVASALTHVAVYPDDTVPVIGASGANAGLLGAFMRLYPAARVLLVVPIVVVPVWFRVPAVVYVGLWFAIQLLQGIAAADTPLAGGGVAWWVHVGGAVAGYLAAGFLPRRLSPPPPVKAGKPASWRVGRWGDDGASGPWGPRDPGR
ncbi:MAG: rhomboid family intramembrane serine protease [Azospirillaceae bacterium]